jgi:signal transduction histidine kinase
MARGSAYGIRILERGSPPLRWWLWGLGFAGAVLAGAGTYALVAGVEALPVVRELYAERRLDEVAAGLLVTAVLLGILALATARAFARSAEVAKRQRAVLDAIIDNAPDALVVADDLGRFRANPAAVRLFGFKSDTGDSADYHAAVARLERRNPETGRRIPAGAGVLESAIAGRALAMDQVIVTPEGPRTVHVSGMPIPLAQGATGGIILASDVTQRLQIQAALQAANAELEAARDGLARKNQEHLQMARAIAHDLGNALTPAEMHVQILKTGRGDLERSLGVMGRSVDQMHRLVGDLSDMARIESGAMSVAVRDVDLEEAVKSALASHQPSAEAKGIRLQAGPVAEVTVRADGERVGQVLSNLLSNAIKFTPEKGTVTVSSAVEGRLARVTVTDSGYGLTQEQIGRLFKAFSRVHDPEKVRERGTGLGLYICRNLVERQGGQMGVASEGPGKGSTFWFTLPLA